MTYSSDTTSDTTSPLPEPETRAGSLAASQPTERPSEASNGVVAGSVTRAMRPRKSRLRARAVAAVFAGRASGALVRRLHIGGGTSLPGLIAHYADPHLIAHLGEQLAYGSVVITGTNGKTTTSGLVSNVLRETGLRIWRNREGSNLARGVATALLMRARPSGRLRDKGEAAFVFEVDEAAFPQVIAELQPRVIVVTNLFRDQLDRYGEVDTVAEKWRATLRRLPATTTLILNADDPAVAALADSHRGQALYLGVEEAPSAGERGPDADVVDTRTCPRCRAPLVFSRRFYSHVGHWACPHCGFSRPMPTVFARSVHSAGLEEALFTLVTPSGEREERVGLPGLYNVYNALAAAAVGTAMGADLEAISRGLGRFTPAFGRAERIEVDGRTLHLLLAKNPTGLNEVMRALAANTTAGPQRHLMMLLNDRAADGEDVSWIWDADFEQIAGTTRSLTVSGTRAYDLALRLKYAGAEPTVVEPEIKSALMQAIERTPAGETLFVVPTYTAMLAVRGELERRGYAPHYWEQTDD